MSSSFARIFGESPRRVYLFGSEFPLLPVRRSPEVLRALAQIIRPLNNVKRVDLLRYHALAKDKYRRLGMVYKMQGVQMPSAEEMEKICAIFREAGLPVRWN